MLRDRSPLARAAQIRRPLLLAMGARDPRAMRAEMDQVAYAARARRAGLVYLVFPDEGAQLVAAPNRLAYLAVLEHFLSDCLGGRAEPAGAAFEGAQLNAYDGASTVPGLSAFARRFGAPTPAATVTPSAAIGESPADTAPLAAPEEEN